MIGGGTVAWVTAVVGGDHHQVLIPQLGQKSRQPGIKFIQRPGVTLRIPAVTEIHVEIHQIHKAQAGKVLLGIVQRMLHAVGIALVVHMLRCAPAGKNVINLAHSDAGKPIFLHRIQKGGFRRLQRKIVTVGGALEAAGLTHKGTGDDPTHAVLALKLGSCNATVFIQLLRGYDVLVGSNLEHRIRRGIDDEISRLHVLLAEFLNDRCAGPGGVCQNTSAGGCPERR